jgi:hypothetical protein
MIPLYLQPMNSEIVLLPDINPYPLQYELLAKLLPVLAKLLDELPYPPVTYRISNSLMNNPYPP